MGEAKYTPDDTDGFVEHLIGLSVDPSSGLSIGTRMLYALMTVPPAIQSACSKEQSERIVSTVIKAAEAAVVAAVAVEGR